MPFYTDSIGGGIGTEPQGYSRGDDGFSGPFPLGFSLTYFGQIYDQFFVNINGNISFGDNGVRTLKSAFFFCFVWLQIALTFLVSVRFALVKLAVGIASLFKNCPTGVLIDESGCESW
jgi:hypothetical protein